jgi:hypothetical protein
MEQQAWNNVSRRQTLKKLWGIFAWGIFANLILPTEGMSPSGKSNISLPQPEQIQITTQQINAIQLNETIPCNSRTALRDFLEQHGYICEYSWSDRLDSTPLKPQEKQKLTELLKPIIEDKKNTNMAIYTLLHHLIKYKMRRHSFTWIDNPDHKQLIWQLEKTMPHWNEPYTYQYVDPAIIKLLDNSNTQSVLKLTYEDQEQSNKKIEAHDDVLDVSDNIYEVNWISKYSPSYAKELLEQQDIWLKSSDKWTQETGNNRSSNRTSLVEINVSSIDGIIALIKNVRTRRNYNQKEYITGGTEFGIHNPWPNWHERWWKLDLGESLLVLIILLEQWINQVETNSRPIQIGNYEYVFDYHGPDRHLDIKIKDTTIVQPLEPSTSNQELLSLKRNNPHTQKAAN